MSMEFSLVFSLTFFTSVLLYSSYQFSKKEAAHNQIFSIVFFLAATASIIGHFFILAEFTNGTTYDNIFNTMFLLVLTFFGVIDIILLYIALFKGTAKLAGDSMQQVRNFGR